MFWDYSEDEICYTLEEQYMYWEDILFATIYKQGCTKRRVYLPQGRCVNAFTKEVVEGSEWMACHAEIDEYIAYVKEGSEVLACFI